jgi:hypothetical protein
MRGLARLSLLVASVATSTPAFAGHDRKFFPLKKGNSWTHFRMPSIENPAATVAVDVFKLYGPVISILARPFRTVVLNEKASQATAKWDVHVVMPATGLVPLWREAL